MTRTNERKTINDEFMDKLWNDYHFLDHKKYDLLYYDKK